MCLFRNPTTNKSCKLDTAIAASYILPVTQTLHAAVISKLLLPQTGEAVSGTNKTTCNGVVRNL
jgi:hypothetical protein